ncbi:MAG: hemolysin family protein [bacterium]|nr:hemolysin family protein [bacterium]
MIALAVAFILACLFLQAFFAGSEMAVISCSRIRVRHKAELGHRRARIIQGFLEEPRSLLATTLVGYNVAVVAGSCVLNNLLSVYAPAGTENLFSLLLYYPLVLIGGQIVPMAVGRQRANTLCLACARWLRVAYRALFPLVFSASRLGDAISRLLTRGKSLKNPFVTREELELMLKESHTAGVLDREEKEMIEEIFHFGETTVREAMVPLINVVAAPDTATAGEVRALIASSRHSRIPVYAGRIDNVIGTVRATDLAGLPADRGIGELLRSPYLVPESASLETVLAGFRRRGRNIAIAVDEYGGVSGIITLMDIAEEIMGEIEDIAEEAPRTAAETIILEGSMRIEAFNEEFGQRLPREAAETIGGFVTGLVGAIPQQGAEVSYENLRFRVLEATDRRVTKVEVAGARHGG